MDIPNKKVNPKTFHDLVYGNRRSLLCGDNNECIVTRSYLLLEEYNFKTKKYTKRYALMWVNYKMKGGALKEGACLLELQLVGPDCIYEGISFKDAQRQVISQINSLNH